MYTIRPLKYYLNEKISTQREELSPVNMWWQTSSLNMKYFGQLHRNKESRYVV